MHKVREIIRLSRYRELSRRQIAAASGASRPVVSQYLQWFYSSGLSHEEVEQLSDSELSQRLHAPQAEHDARYRDLQRRLETYVRELGNKHVTRRLLWEEYRREVPDGYGYTQFCYYLQIHLESGGDLVMHLEHTPGEKVFLDYAGYKPKLLDLSTGAEIELALFVATFPASGLIYCEVRRSERLAETVEATQNTLWFAGGVPLMLVPDNLRSAVTKPDRYEPEINATFEDMAAHYGCVVVPARSGRPKDKALVEKAVELVYKRVIAPLRHRSFTCIEELNEAYWENLDALNSELMQRSGLSRRHRFEAHERDELKPLPHERYVLRRFRELKVAFNYHIYLRDDGHYYSVPYGYRGKRVRVAVSYDTVEIFSDRTRIATHRRDQTSGGYSTKREHMPDHHRDYAEWSPGRSPPTRRPSP